MLRRVLPTVAAILVTALCLAAANWQWHRMEYKEDLRARYERAIALPALDNAGLPRAAADWTALRYRPVQLTGSFEAARQILLDNRVQAGQVGYEVVAPLRLTDGRVVLVDRGWVAQGRTRTEIPPVPPPAGVVTVTGTLELPAQDYVALGSERPGVVWQHLDLARYAAVTGLTPLPLLVRETAPASAADTLVRMRDDPDFGIDTHRMYMLQWLAFAMTTVVFWAVAHRPRRWRRA